MFEKPRSMSCISQIIRGSKGKTGLLSYIYTVHLTDFCFGRKKGQNCSSMLLIMFVGAQLGGLYQGWETKQVMLQSGICFLLIPVSSVLFAFRNQWATIMTDVPTSGCISCLEIHYIKVTFVLHGQLQLVLQVSYKDRDVSSLVLFPQSTVGTMSSQACLAELFEDRTRAREQELHFQWQQGHTNCM